MAALYEELKKKKSELGITTEQVALCDMDSAKV